MKRDNLISLVVSSILLGSTLSALTLKEAVQETLETNPVVKERYTTPKCQDNFF